MSLRFGSISLLGLALAGLAAWTTVELARPPRLNVIVLTMESARADAIGPETTPKLWAIARAGARFTRHYAVSAWTAPNIVSLLSGLGPQEHGVHTRGQSAPEAWQLPLERLAEAGWRVAGLQPFMLVDVFQALGLAVEPGVDPLYWLAEAALSGTPFVLWYHYLGTHLPYRPASGYRPDWQALLDHNDPAARERIEAVMSRPAIPAGSVAFTAADRPAVAALYRAGFRQFDDWFARFWSFLEASGLGRNTIVVLTADHGEELIERGNVGHASTTHQAHLYEEVVHVPLVLWLPPGATAGLAAGTVVDRPTDHHDVMPTLLAALGQASPITLPGRDLARDWAERPWAALSSGAGYAEDDPKAVSAFVHAWREGRWKLHLHRRGGSVIRTELYDLDRDPGERRDLAAAEPELVARLQSRLLAHLAAARKPSESRALAAVSGPRPRWLHPTASGAYGFDDAGGRVWFEWSGAPDAGYRLQYEAGSGLLKLDGELRVAGTRKDFGRFDREYWDKWIVAYSPYRLRVGYDAPEPNWGDWLELRAE